MLASTLDGQWCFRQVGGLEVALTPERLARAAPAPRLAPSWGIEGRLLDPDEIVAAWPLLDRDGVLGGYLVPTDGLAKAVRACEAQARRANEARRPLPRRARPSPASAPTTAGSRPSSRPAASSRRTSSSAPPGIWGPRVGAHGRGPGPAPAARAPVRQDLAAARAGRDRRPGRPRGPAADPAASRTATCTPASTSTAWVSGPTATARCRSTRRRSSPPADAPGDALGAAVHARRLRPVVGLGAGRDPRAPRGDLRGGHQRRLLVHDRRHAADGRVARRARLLAG